MVKSNKPIMLKRKKRTRSVKRKASRPVVKLSKSKSKSKRRKSKVKRGGYKKNKDDDSGFGVL